jgi:hypothetical protein
MPCGKKEFFDYFTRIVMFSIQYLFGQKKGIPQEPIRPFSYIDKEVSFVNKVDGTVI